MSRLLLATLMVALLAPRADSGTIVTQMDTNTPIMTFTIPSQGIYGEGGYVGPNSVKLDKGPFVSAYCTNLFRSINVDDNYSASIQPLSDLPGGSVVAQLFAADAHLGGSTPTDKAALQLAIWDVVESARVGVAPLDPLAIGTLTTTDYNVKNLLDISTNSVNMIAVMDRVSCLLNLAPKFAPATLTYIAPGDYGQGFVELAAVPEPASFITAGIGLTGVLVMRLRRRSAKG